MKRSALTTGLQCLWIIALILILQYLTWSAPISEQRSLETERARLLYKDGFKGGFGP